MSALPPRGRGRGRGIPRPTRPGSSSAPGPAATTLSAPAPSTSTDNPPAQADPPDFSRPLPAPRTLGTLRDPAPVGFRPGGANLARKPEDLARTGVSRLKFMPKLPMSRPKKEPEDVKPGTPTAGPSRGTERGRGRGRSAPPPGAGRGELQMTASGPFALGPSALLSSSRPRPSRGPGSAGPVPAVPGSDSTGKRSAVVLADAEQYSDEEVEIVDLDLVEGLDDSAPSSLKRVRVLRGRERTEGKREARLPRVEDIKAKLEPEEAASASLHSSARPTTEPETPPDEKNANALDLSESEDDEEAEDMLDDFMFRGRTGAPELDPTRERFYFFQFPSPFPSFLPAPTQVVDVDAEMPDADPLLPPSDAPAGEKEKEKQVRFSGEGVKLEDGRERKPSIGSPGKGIPPKVDGVIGRMELFRDGRVRLVLGEDIAMEVHPAAETAFLENVVHLDPSTKQMTSLGSVERRFVVSPDLDALLTEL
ncbi:hypothetical protein CALVIDRAFT_547944, partial [Calocera viscosa TUFC12733]